jgi:hypothetical protein
MVQRIGALLAIVFFLSAATDVAAQRQFAYRISFRDKTGAPPLSANPAWLSPRAMARRANFGISLDSTDRPVSPVYVDSVLRLTNGILHTTSRWLNQCVILVDDSARRNALAGSAFISNVEWVGYFAGGLHQKTAPEPQREPVTVQARTTGTAAHYGSTWTAVDMVHGDYLHDQGFTGRGKLIAVIDEGFTGVDTHPGLDSMRRAGRLLETHNFLQNTSNVYTSGSHGTSCLSIIAGNRPGTYVGTAPDAEYALYITEDGSVTDAVYELDNLIAAMERSDSLGVDVISASIVYNIFVSPFSTAFTKAELDGHTTNVARATNLASGKGIVYVSSAGNEGTNNWNFLNSPGDADSALTVGSVNSSRSASGFSSPGPNSSGRVKPDVCLLGEPVPVFDGFGNTFNQNGTSFAAPQLAGYVACMLQANPRARPAVIRNAVQRISDRYAAPTAKLGYGIPDFRGVIPYLGVPDAAQPLELSLAPNPFMTMIRVRVAAHQGLADFRLYDPSGRPVGIQVGSVGGGVFQLTVPESLPQGVYFLEARADGKRVTARVLHLN